MFRAYYRLLGSLTDFRLRLLSIGYIEDVYTLRT
jgi:hypothetical protein